MNKRIIILMDDVPESCDVCPFEEFPDMVCGVGCGDTSVNGGLDRWEKRLPNCKIRQLPKPIVVKHDPSYSHEYVMKMNFANGYNTCLSEILGGGNESE